MKEEIVKRFLDEGVLISPKTLRAINEHNIDDFIRKAKNEKEIVFENKNKEKDTITMKNTIKKQKLTTQDFVSYFNNRYEGLKKILLEKTDAVSINKTKNAFHTVSVIGMVSEYTPNGFFLEDTTGVIETITEKRPEKDDVVCVKGDVREGKLFASEIIYTAIIWNLN